MLLLAFALAATPPDAHALVDGAIVAMQHTASLRDLHSLRLTGLQHEFVLGNAERAEGPWRTSYTTFTELRDLHSGASRRTDRSMSPAGLSPERTTVLVDSVAFTRSGERDIGGSISTFEDVVDRIDGSPERALLLAAASPKLTVDGTAKHFGMTYDVVSFPWRNGRMKIEINRDTHLPDAVEIDRAYPDNFRWNIFSTVAMRADYVDWNIMPSGLYYPMQVKITFNGQPLRDVSYTNAVAKTAEAPADSFVVSDSARKLFASASRFSFSRFAYGSRGQPKELAPGIVRVPDQWAMTLVKQPDGIVIFEAHISNTYVHDLVADAKRRWPGTPIKAFVLTSDPWAHLGGLREAASLGVPIYTSAGSIPFFTSLLAGAAKPKFVPVTGKTTIGNGDNRIELFPVGGPYAERMLMAYFPTQKLLYGADLVFPNRGPDGKAAAGFQITEATDLRNAVAREGLAVDSVFCVQQYNPFAWTDFLK